MGKNRMVSLWIELTNKAETPGYMTEKRSHLYFQKILDFVKEKFTIQYLIRTKIFNI